MTEDVSENIQMLMTFDWDDVGVDNMIDEKGDKIRRVLEIYDRLLNGRIINKTEEAGRYGVNERSIQRDIDDIRIFLSDFSAMKGDSAKTVEYSRTDKGFYLTGNDGNVMTNSEILALCKILLESRAFSAKRVKGILDKLILGCAPRANMELVGELVSNEEFHYNQVSGALDSLDTLWELAACIKEQQMVDIYYIRSSDDNSPIKRTIEPVSIMFSEYYFYLQGYIVDKTGEDTFEHKYDYPAIFRVDRITDLIKKNKKYKMVYANRFEEGEFRKRVQFMTPGKLTKVKFIFYGHNCSFILDRMPTARVIECNKEKTEYTIETEVYGKGIIMWLLSQGSKIKVISPTEIVDEMKAEIKKMQKLYK